MARTPRKSAELDAQQVEAPKPRKGIVLHKTNMRHVFQMDINDDGIFKEVVVIKAHRDGSVSYIETGLLDNVDRGRLVKILRSSHAAHYEMWDLLSQERLSNGMNALDYFHQMTKHKIAPGGSLTNTMRTNSLATAIPQSDEMVGANFSDPGSAQISPGDIGPQG